VYNDLEEKMKLKRILTVDWDVIAGIIAAVAAIVMHFLHLIEEDILLMIAVVLIALLFIRDLRRERLAERIADKMQQTETTLKAIQTNLLPPDAILIGPKQLRIVTERFAVQANGEMIWFNICLTMFKPQYLFDTLLRPAIENPQVTSIQFILEEKQKTLWDSDVLPKINACSGSSKVLSPRWVTIHEPISLIISDVASRRETECLLSFWGEPFMARSHEISVPRYVFHVQGHSELMARLVELERHYRFTG
jgi:hypothetical protein